MKLLNTKIESLMYLFGEEGIAMLKEYPDLHVCLATPGMFPQLDAFGTVGGCVLLLNPNTLEILPATGGELALLIYPDAMIADALQVPESERERFHRSYLVHELTHVKQYMSGRLVVVEAGKMIWEGVLMNVTLEGYVEFPWEREAYLAQFEYIFKGDKELAARGYKQVIGMVA